MNTTLPKVGDIVTPRPGVPLTARRDFPTIPHVVCDVAVYEPGDERGPEDTVFWIVPVDVYERRAAHGLSNTDEGAAAYLEHIEL